MSESKLGRDPDKVDLSEQRPRERGYLIFRLGSSMYAFIEEQVAFVAPFSAPVRVPTAPAYFQGVAHLRGRIVAVVNLAEVIGLPLDAKTGESLLDRRLVVLEAEQRSFAVVVDSVIGHHQVLIGKVEETSPEKVGRLQAHQMIDGQFEQLGEGIVVTLSAPALLKFLIEQEQLP